MKGAKKIRYSKTIDIVSYALKVSVNGVIYVFGRGGGGAGGRGGGRGGLTNPRVLMVNGSWK